MSHVKIELARAADMFAVGTWTRRVEALERRVEIASLQERRSRLRATAFHREHRLCTRTLPPGEYRLQASSGPFAPAWWPGTEDPELAEVVRVRASEKSELGAMTVRPTGSIRVELPGWDEDLLGAPRFEIAREVEVAPGGDSPEEPVEPKWERVERERVQTWTQPQAEAPRWTLLHVSEGRWQLRVCPELEERCDGSRDVRTASGPVAVVRGEEASVGLVAPPGENR